MYLNNVYSKRSAAQNKASALLFEDKFYKNLDDDDETVITSNLLNKSVYTGSYRREGLLNENRQQRSINKKRAPKIAAFILISIFAIGGLTHIRKSLREIPLIDENNSSSGANLSSISKKNGTDNLEKEHFPVSIEVLFEEMSKPNLDMNGNQIRLPTQLTNLADMNAPMNRNHEVPIFWHIPRTGGSNFKKIASFCYGLTLASEVGPSVDPVAATKNELMTVIDADSGTKFLNVDTTSPEGLERAKKLNVATFEGLDLITTPYIFMASDVLFNPLNRGRFIVMFRHPIDRAVSMYYYLRDKTGIKGAQIGDSLELYAKSAMVENNWMTRFLTNKLGGQLTPDDEATAKEVLRTKCLVGLLNRKTESMQRFKTYFGWKTLDNDESRDCEEKQLHWGWTGKNKHDKLEVGSDAWNLLKEQNSFDIRLFEYAEKLFEIQGKTLFSKSPCLLDKNGC